MGRPAQVIIQLFIWKGEKKLKNEIRAEFSLNLDQKVLKIFNSEL